METKLSCSLLPSDISEKVIKVDLDQAYNETARSLLIVTPNGSIKEHTHQEGYRPDGRKIDSEIYIDLLDYAVNGPDKMKNKPEVAGSNSPTGRLQHSVEPSQQARVILAIKRGQLGHEWQDLANLNLADFIEKLNIKCEYDQKQGMFSFNSSANKERVNFVQVDLIHSAVKCLSKETVSMQDNVWIETSLEKLEAAQQAQKQDLGMSK